MTDFDPTTDPDPSRPGCEAGQAALQYFLDGDPAWDTPESTTHRAECRTCREEFALARSLSTLATPVVVPVELTSRLLTAMVSADRFRRRVRYVGAGFAVAASLLVTVILTQPEPQTISEARTVALVTPKAEPSRPLGESMSEARDALVQLTRRTANETRQTSTSLIPNPKLTDMPDPGEGLEPLSDARSGAVRSVEPLRTSARRAVNLFLRAADPPNRAAVQ